MMFLIFLDASWNLCEANIFLQESQEMLGGKEPVLTSSDVVCIVSAEVLDPFIWSTGFLWVAFGATGLYSKYIKKQ